jgi:F-type H+-transporting ATPase subunit alpha
LKLALAQFRELEAFAQFGSDLDETTKSQLEFGRRINEILKQGQFKPIVMEKQVAIFYAANSGELNDIPVEKIQDFEANYFEYLETQGKKVLDSIRKENDISEATEAALKKHLADFKQAYLTK